VIRELSVKNLALIEDLRVELAPGFCVWTGETGAGKSLLLTALGLVLGSKASADLIRAGQSEAVAAAVFDLAREPEAKAAVTQRLGETLEDDQLIVTRRISAGGRGLAYANGLPVPISTLKALGAILVELHGQHETDSLFDPVGQRALLDAHGGHQGRLDAYRAARSEYEEIRKRRDVLLESAAARRRERDLLLFERDELQSATPRVSEYEELNQEARRLGQAGAIREAAAEGLASLYEDERSAQALIGRVQRRLEAIADAAPEAAEAAQALDRIAEETKEIAFSLRDLIDRSGDDPNRLEEIEARLALYRKLAQRFRKEPDELPAHLEAIEAKLAEIERDEEDLSRLDGPLAEAWDRLKQTTAALSEARSKAAKSWTKAIKSHLKDLSLGDARLEAVVETEPIAGEPGAPAPGEHGADRVELRFAPNSGEPPRPLRKIASGGERSRLALAVLTVLAGADRTPTLVFDEIDAGVGGRLGRVLGKKLAALSAHHQVLCVTHLPQLASYADHQWVIRKERIRGRTRATIEEVWEDDRVEELAAMLRGDSAAEGTRQEAISMLVEARSDR